MGILLHCVKGALSKDEIKWLSLDSQSHIVEYEQRVGLSRHIFGSRAGLDDQEFVAMIDWGSETESLGVH